MCVYIYICIHMAMYIYIYIYIYTYISPVVAPEPVRERRPAAASEGGRRAIHIRIASTIISRYNNN